MWVGCLIRKGKTAGRDRDRWPSEEEAEEQHWLSRAATFSIGWTFRSAELCSDLTSKAGLFFHDQAIHSIGIVLNSGSLDLRPPIILMREAHPWVAGHTPYLHRIFNPGSRSL